ncbi:MAG TPA: tetratricopeptide repeat protein, partial [Thermoanaerobaculia bacterium]
GQASTLVEMGNLYYQTGRLEEAAHLHQQAATLYEELEDSINQSLSLNNLAIVLQALGRLDEAREAATHTARLKVPFGHAAEPWKTWKILQDIETLAGRPDAASAARFRASEFYTAYRRDGGEPQFSTARLIAVVGQVLREHGAEEARRLIRPPEQFDEELLPVRDALLAILDGSRDPALAKDARLDYDDAVELSLLLDRCS